MLDSIFYTRELKKHGIGVIFMNDGINTMDGDAELRFAIMSSIAQEESRKTSPPQFVKWGRSVRWLIVSKMAQLIIKVALNKE